MAELSDHELLTNFARTGAENAFATLVTRHVNLVFSTARRFTSDDHLAEEITQAVFIILARKAGGISARVVLTGWLYQTARLTAANALKENIRRQRREQEAYMESTLTTAETDEAWKQIAPVLDDAMGDLREADRNAVLLRYFENQPLAEVGAALGVSEDAARVRVNRALEKLRATLTKSGVTLGATAITGAVTANAIQAAPIALTASITAAALTGTSLTLATVAMTTLQKIAVTAALTVTIGAGIYQAKQASDAHEENKMLQAQQAPLAEQIQQLQVERDKDMNAIALLKEELAKNEKNNLELLKLRGEIGLLKNKLDTLSKANKDLQKELAKDGKISPDAHTNAVARLQLHIKSRFISMPKGTLAGLQGFMGSPSADGESHTGILNYQNFTNVFAQVSRRKGVKFLGEPEVTTGDGRQTQMRATQMIDVTTNVALLETNDTAVMMPENTQVEIGPMLDVTPSILSDGYSIALPVTVSLTDFLGYEATSKTTLAYAKNGARVDLPEMSPQFNVKQATASANVFDNQTMVISLESKAALTGGNLQKLTDEKLKTITNEVLVFITATIVDPAGNRKNEKFEADGTPDQSPPASN